MTTDKEIADAARRAIKLGAEYRNELLKAGETRKRLDVSLDGLEELTSKSAEEPKPPDKPPVWTFRSGYITGRDTIRRNGIAVSFTEVIERLEAAEKVEAEPCHTCEGRGRVLSRIQPCGCVVCQCRHPGQCSGCGAQDCGKFQAGKCCWSIYGSKPRRQPCPDCTTEGEADGDA